MIQYSIVLTAFQYVNHILHGILWTAITMVNLIQFSLPAELSNL